MSIEEKYDEVRQLINVGKEKGYLLYDEVNEILPSEITSSEELDDSSTPSAPPGSKSSIPTRPIAATRTSIVKAPATSPSWI